MPNKHSGSWLMTPYRLRPVGLLQLAEPAHALHIGVNVPRYPRRCRRNQGSHVVDPRLNSGQRYAEARGRPTHPKGGAIFPVTAPSEFTWRPILSSPHSGQQHPSNHFPIRPGALCGLNKCVTKLRIVATTEVIALIPRKLASQVPLPILQPVQLGQREVAHEGGIRIR